MWNLRSSDVRINEEICCLDSSAYEIEMVEVKQCGHGFKCSVWKEEY